ncbi:serine/threonine-protein kinase [Krasilnikovia cinnamomea]|uniref:non-specific serine/threonine protein kinase n=1 Tax=Krasilnikovia cinnamomea TaxID=349313 RepID=A0A4Q7ZL79_9ACTN|nr:Stk1 family PASTA domain-containing Ser/Thr kinase [Krasilnikovia cinnamomea]RZU50959.1 serine/threonine-protein kinase [Krasilnikovia cinnamomea]
MTAQARLLGGRYQVGELLGYGGMAEVHRGRDLRLGRDVAIKMLRTDLARDATFQERFRREAQNAAALNHPAIVAVYDTGEEVSSTGEKLPFIVMEYVNGRTLKEVLAAEQRIQPRRALEMIADICAALEFSHRHGIIHRDIKPGNVMLTQNGQVKVMDFGIARALASGATTMTQTSAVIGTAQYLSPEQARGESVDARSDVYAAGCVLFELVVGHPPFVGDSPVSVAYQHVREDPRAPSQINREVPPDVDAIVLKALAKNPLNRYQSAQEMRADALRAVAGRPVMATPVMSEAETMALGGPMYQQSGQTTMTRPIPGAMPPQSPQRRSSSFVVAILSALAVLALVAAGVGFWLNNKGDTGQQQEPVTVAMPKLVGLTPDDARDALARRGLTGITEGDPDTGEDCTKGKISKQDPPANQLVEKTVPGSYTVCTGPAVVLVPDDLRGATKEQAVTAFAKARLVPDFDSVNSDAPVNTVVSVERAGEHVAPGTKIKVQISRGNVVEVPPLKGKNEDQARAALDAVGLSATVADGPPSDTPGVVVDQNPKAGRKLAKGGTVTIFISVPQTSPTPSGSVSPSPDDTTPPGGNGGGDDPLGGLLQP